MNIAYLALGGPLKLKGKYLKRFNGTTETYLTLWILTRNPSFDKVYISSLDWNKLTSFEKQELDPRGVIVNFYKNGDKDSLYNAWKNLDISFAIVKGEYAWGSVCSNKKVWKNEKEYYKPMSMMWNYSWGVLNYLNKTKLPYFLIILDPRTISHAGDNGVLHRSDSIHRPVEIMSQLNMNLKWRSMKEFVDSFEKQEYIETDVPVGYRETEKVGWIHYYKNDIYEKTNKLIMGTMQDTVKGARKSRRFNMIKEWLIDFDTNKEIEIYGKWDEHFEKQFEQFKGFLPHEQLDEKLKRTKYSFIIGIKQDWATSKFPEILSMDIVPFIAPDYDTQYNVIDKDDWIRVKTPQELWEKIEYLEKNPEKRIELIKELKKRYFVDLKDGIFFYKALNKALTPLNLHIREDQDLTINRKTNALF